MKKFVYVIIINMMCLTLSSCISKYEEELTRTLSETEKCIDSNNESIHQSIHKKRNCMKKCSEDIEMVIIESKGKIYRSSNISNYVEWYERILKKYYEIENNYFAYFIDSHDKYLSQRLRKNVSYKDYMNYTPEYRLKILGINHFSLNDYNLICGEAKELIDVSSIPITHKMMSYCIGNYREYFPSMDRLKGYKNEILQRLLDERYLLNEEYKVNSGDYIKQKEYADKIEHLTKLIDKLDSGDYFFIKTFN